MSSELNFIFHIFYCNLQQKDPIRRKLNSKNIFVCEISIIIILICEKLGLVTPVQQNIKLPLTDTISSYYNKSFLSVFLRFIFCEWFVEFPLHFF